MSILKDKSLQYITVIKKNFESFNPNNKGIIETQKLNDFINLINSKEKNRFIYNSIKSLTALKEQENEEGISSEEYISFIDNLLRDDKSKEGLKNIFNVFCDGNTGNISWNTFPLIARELGDDEIADKLLNIISQSKIFTKDLDFNEFFELMNNENEEENNNISQNNETSENNENLVVNNMRINEIKEEIEDFEENQTLKQRKMIEKQKEIEDDMNSSSKNSAQDNDGFIVEKFYNNQKQEDKNIDNDKNNKRYHRRYRSKKVKSNYSMNDKNENNNHKSYSKYRKNHINY
jgi:Ca2+-binding EF-hand superfamily protein